VIVRRARSNVASHPRARVSSESARNTHDTSIHRLTSHSLVLRRAASEGGGVTHEGVTLHDASFAHKALGTGFGAVMWFWVFYRFYHDGDTLIYGHAPHFEHDDDDHH
jgi:hypothetical protein